MMTDITIQSLEPIWPELFMAIAGMALLVISVLQKGNATRFASWGSVWVVVMALVIMLGREPTGESILNGMFVYDRFALFMKGLVLVGLIVSLSLAVKALYKDHMARFEYPLLILFAGIGMMLMISATDMLSLYVGLELQSLSLYVLAAIRRDHIKSAESGMKYFILGAISSGMLLFGISLLYGFTGSTNFEVIGSTLSEEISIGAIFGFVFVLAALAFKISAAPFHMWTPDVYEGAPTPVTALFALVPKIAAFALIIRLLFIPFAPLSEQWFQILWLLSALSMAVGAFAALRQDNIKRLMAYSSISNVGYALIGLVAGGEAGIASVLVYLALYMVMVAGTFAIILCMRRDGRAFDKISDLAGLSRNSPWLAYSLAILMFSMSGIPPMAGFFGKLMVFQAAVQSGLYILAVFGVLTSVVAVYYYLRVIKVMFFDEPVDAFDKNICVPVRIVAALSVLIVVVFIMNPSPLIETAQFASLSLFS